MANQFGKVTLSLTLLMLLFLLGCGGAESDPSEGEVEDEAVSTADVADETESETETAEAEPTAEPTATPSPTPTPIPPELELETDETIYIDDKVVVTAATAPEDGWLVVWPATGAELNAEDALAFIEVESGDEGRFEIPIDGSEIKVSELQVGLHGGRTADDDAFGADGDNLILIQQIEIETAATRPTIEPGSTVVSDDGFLQIKEVRSNGPAWVAIYDGTKENLLGFRAVPAGISEDVDVPVQWHNATTELYVVLLSDLGNVGEFEDGIDEPVSSGGELVGVDLEVGLPAEIVVFDQPMEASALIDRVTSPVDGYVAVFGDSDSDGFPNTIIGSAPIKKGVTEFLTVELEIGTVTTQTIFSIYTDSDQDGAFDYFEDEPVLFSAADAEPAPLFVTARSDIEGFLVVDHLSGSDLVRVDWVATPLDAWLVVEKLPAEDGQSPLGQAAIPVGLHHSLEIPISGVNPGDAVRVLLYINNPDPELFEPERNDFPLLADGRLVFVEFTVR